LRKLFETKKDNIVSLPCYQDDFNNIYNITKSELKSFNPSHEIISYIAHHLAGDRLLLQQELTKLKIYFHSCNEINFETVELLLSVNYNSDYQNLTNAIADKEAQKTSVILEDLLNSGTMAITIIRVIINYFQRIKIVRYAIDSSLNFNEAIKDLKPPVFFKQKQHLERHIYKWSLRELNLLLQKLENLEKTIKTNNVIKSDIMLKYFILMLSNRR
jgi:DNA polymerase-3 subunit delta